MATQSALLKDYNPFDPETLIHPYPYLEALRAEAPVYHCPKTGLFIVSTYDLVREVVSNNEVFSSLWSRVV